MAGDIFGGYSFLNGGDGDRQTVHGWQANVSGNVTDHVGIVGDVAGHYDEGVDFLEYMGGVRYNGRADGVNPFAQALIGAVRASDGSDSENFFSMGFGGGVDIRANDRVSVRAVEFNWLPIRVGEMWETSFIRLGFGIVIHVP
jgi:hypothetical protein